MALPHLIRNLEFLEDDIEVNPDVHNLCERNSIELVLNVENLVIHFIIE